MSWIASSGTTGPSSARRLIGEARRGRVRQDLQSPRWASNVDSISEFFAVRRGSPIAPPIARARELPSASFAGCSPLARARASPRRRWPGSCSLPEQQRLSPNGAAHVAEKELTCSRRESYILARRSQRLARCPRAARSVSRSETRVPTVAAAGERTRCTGSIDAGISVRSIAGPPPWTPRPTRAPGRRFDRKPGGRCRVSRKHPDRSLHGPDGRSRMGASLERPLGARRYRKGVERIPIDIDAAVTHLERSELKRLFKFFVTFHRKRIPDYIMRPPPN